MPAVAFPRSARTQGLVGGDESFSRVPYDELRAGGITALIRYITGDGKGMDGAEFDAAIAAGFSVAWVMETFEQAASLGYSQGVKEADAAYAAADAIGWPKDRPGYFVAEDPYPVNRTAWPAVADYFRAVVSAGPDRPLPGAYGSGALCAYLAGLGLIGHQWHVSTWPGVDRAVADIVQEANGLSGYGTFGGAIDLNTIRDDNPDWGQHPFGGPGPTDVPGLEHLHPTFAARVANACRARGTSVYSGARTSEEQARLYQDYLAGRGNPANPPGTSWHEYGPDLTGGSFAIAVDFDPPYPHGEPGLIFPVTGEPWHGQPSEVTEPARVAGAEDRIPALPPTPPEEEAELALAIVPIPADGRPVIVPLPQLGNRFDTKMVSITLVAGPNGATVRAVLGPDWHGLDPANPENLSIGADGRVFEDIGTSDVLQVTNKSASPEQPVSVLVEAK